MTMVVPATAKALTVTPLFLVSDVVRTAEHYRDHLGFRILNYYGGHPASSSAGATAWTSC